MLAEVVKPIRLVRTSEPQPSESHLCSYKEIPNEITDSVHVGAVSGNGRRTKDTSTSGRRRAVANRCADYFPWRRHNVGYTPRPLRQCFGGNELPKRRKRRGHRDLERPVAATG